MGFYFGPVKRSISELLIVVVCCSDKLNVKTILIVLHNPNGITAGDPGIFGPYAVIVTDYRPSEDPYKLQSITGETLGWVSEYTIAE